MAKYNLIFEKQFAKQILQNQVFNLFQIEKMVFGVMILDVERMKLFFSAFYGEEANDTKKNLRLKFLMTKLQSQCTQSTLMHKDNIDILNSVKLKSILNPKFKSETKEISPKKPIQKTIFNGTIYVESSDLFKEDKIMIWKRKYSIALAFIISNDECINQAMNTLDKAFQEIVMNDIYEQQWENIIKKLQILIPEGHLAFFSPSNIDFFLSSKSILDPPPPQSYSNQSSSGNNNSADKKDTSFHQMNDSLILNSTVQQQQQQHQQ